MLHVWIGRGISKPDGSKGDLLATVQVAVPDKLSKKEQELVRELAGGEDSSPRKHASLHFRETGHPVMRSFEEGEKWRWCFVDEVVG